MSEDQVDIHSLTPKTASERFFESGNHGVETGSLEYTFLKTAMEIEEGGNFNAVNPELVEVSAYLGVGELKDQICEEYLLGKLTDDEFSAAQDRFLNLGNQAISMYKDSGAILETELLKNSIGTVGISNKDIVGFGDSHGIEVPTRIRAKAHEESFETTGKIEEPKTRKREWLTGARNLFSDLKEEKISKDEYDEIIKLANQCAPEGLTLDEQGVEGSLADRLLSLANKSKKVSARFKKLLRRKPAK